MTELEGKNSLLGTDLVYKTDQQQLIQGTVRQETCTQENCITVERENYLGAREASQNSLINAIIEAPPPQFIFFYFLLQIRRSLRLSVCAFYIRVEALYTLKHHPAESVTSDFFIVDPMYRFYMLGWFLPAYNWVECSRCEKWEHCICAKVSPSVAAV